MRVSLCRKVPIEKPSSLQVTAGSGGGVGETGFRGEGRSGAVLGRVRRWRKGMRFLGFFAGFGGVREGIMVVGKVSMGGWGCAGWR